MSDPRALVALARHSGANVERETAALAVAESQHGVLCRDQARKKGLSDRQIGHRVATGRWERVLPCVFRVAGAPVTWQQRLSAAALWAEHDYALSHRTAAAIHGFERYKKVDEADRVIEVSTIRHMRRPPGLVTHRVDTLPKGDVETIDGVRVTTVTRTLLDLATVEPATMVRAAIDEALRRKWTTVEKLAAALQRVPSEPGTAFLKQYLARLSGDDGPCESELEARVYELFDDYGLPRPVRQRVVRTAGRARRLDFLIPDTNVVIEADSYAYHSSVDVFEKDRDRNNELIARGLCVLHWTWAALHERPHELVEQLLHVLASRRT